MDPALAIQFGNWYKALTFPTGLASFFIPGIPLKKVRMVSKSGVQS
jgi:hypothetical protein